jgi:hypothetical protein
MYPFPGAFPNPAFQEQLDRAGEALAGGVLVGLGAVGEIVGFGELVVGNLNLAQASAAMALGEVAIRVGLRVLHREPLITNH